MTALPSRLLTALALVFVSLPGTAADQPAGCPTDNPVASYYDGPEGYPAWTDAIRWANAINMRDYTKGRTHFEKFESARDELAAQGGGVLYYPPGVYDFTEGPYDGPDGRGLMLRSGVVIRGAAPDGKPNAARDQKLELKTRFVFGFKKREGVVDGGERLSVWLDGALYEERTVGPRGKTEVVRQPRRLEINLPFKDGRPVFEEARLFASYHGRSDHVVQVKGASDAEGLSLEIALEVKALLDPKKKDDLTARRGTYAAKLRREGRRLAGTFAGTYEGQEMKGEAGGLFGRAEAQTPRDWNLIGLKPEPGKSVKDVESVGICWVHLDGAVIYFGPEMTWGASWKTANTYKGPNVKPAWATRKADGVHPYDPFVGALPAGPAPGEGGKPAGRGAGRGRLVFGCVLERAALTNDFETCGRKEAPDGFGPEGYHMAKFTGRITAYGSRLLVANNWLPRSEGNFKYSQMTVQTAARRGNEFFIGQPAKATVLWDYGRTMGVDVNKDSWGLVGQNAKQPGEGYYLPYVAVLDNCVWNHGHKGFNISGDWVVIRNNRNDRAFLRSGDDIYGIGGGWRLTLDGYIQSAPGGGGMISDNLSRAFDLAGRNIWIDGNQFSNTGSSPGIDGEGILCQGFGGTFLRSWSITHNRHDRGQGHGGWMGPFNVSALGLLIAWNKTDAWVGMEWRNNEVADLAFVANQAREVRHHGKALIESKGVPSAPRDVQAELIEADLVRISWTDTADNEIGFRVDRRIEGGEWARIAYRPPQIEKHPDNPPQWVDFLAPPGKKLLYRVVALNADDDDKGAGQPTQAVTVPLPARR